jgi:glycosyltransferase involved in cell wall biosynthesis
MRHGKKIGVVIPALNEEQAIGRVIADVPAWADDIVVVDNGSHDGTARAAEVAGARVIAEPERGYGAACQAGIKALVAPDIIVFLDGDYSDRPQEMSALIDPIASGDFDLVVGSRVSGKRGPGALTPQQRFGNWLACRLIRRIWGAACSDLGPFRAIRTSALRDLDMQDRAYGWTVEMQLKAVETGLRYLEVPVSYRARIGVSKISGTLRGSLLAGITILGAIARSAWRAHRSA